MIGIISAIVGAVIVGGTIACFWEDIINWLKSIFMSLKEKVRATIGGLKIILKKLSKVLFEVQTDYYTEEMDGYYKNTERKKVSYDELPPEVKKDFDQNKYKTQEDITGRVKLELQNSH